MVERPPMDDRPGISSWCASLATRRSATKGGEPFMALSTQNP